MCCRANQVPKDKAKEKVKSKLNLLHPKIKVARPSLKVKGLAGSRKIACAREPYELNSGAHERQPTCPVDVLVRGAIDVDDGATAKLQQLTRQARTAPR